MTSRVAIAASFNRCRQVWCIASYHKPTRGTVLCSHRQSSCSLLSPRCASPLPTHGLQRQCSNVIAPRCPPHSTPLHSAHSAAQSTSSSRLHCLTPLSLALKHLIQPLFCILPQPLRHGCHPCFPRAAVGLPSVLCAARVRPRRASSAQPHQPPQHPRTARWRGQLSHLTLTHPLTHMQPLRTDTAAVVRAGLTCGCRTDCVYRRSALTPPSCTASVRR